MKHTLAVLSGLLLLGAGTLTTHAANITFGTGLNQFDIEFVEIGNAGNAADTTGDPDPAGAVGYIYNIGKHEISEDMVTKAIAEGGLAIAMATTTNSNNPATTIDWFEAATFVNWLNTSQGHQAAYRFDGGGSFQLWNSAEAWQSDGENRFRHKDAFYFLPSADEWYKAAYYDPTSGTYFDFPTGSDTKPNDVAGGTAAGTAVYFESPSPVNSQTRITNAGGLSPYGTMAQGGNVWEWEETALDLMNDNVGEDRGWRGGSWINPGEALQSDIRGGQDPTFENYHTSGFRVAMIPEPSRALLSLLGLGGVLMRRRR